MSEVSWIKLDAGIFGNRKIAYLRRLPDGNNIVLIWIMLLTMAGRCNSGGVIFLTEDIPYTPKMLADELGFEENTVKLALDALYRLKMISTSDEFIVISGWEEHQNIEGMERIREQNRIRKQRQRDREKLTECDCPVTVTQCHATDKIREDKIREEENRIDYIGIGNAFNCICTSFPKVRNMSESRKAAIRARLAIYSLDDFKLLFEKAQASSFLKGANDRNWQATFDWLIADRNMAKVLDGNFDDKPSAGRKANELQASYDMMAKWAEEGG